MKISYRMGLDLGTNSLGWALWELGPDGPISVVDAGVRIFSDGREPGRGGTPGEPLAVNRRNARGMRRRRDRLLQRKRLLVQILIKEGLWPDDIEKRLKYSGWDPYMLRAKALKEPLEPEELGRILLHLSQRRGFKSNRKEAAKEDEEGINKQRIRALDEDLKANSSRTLGEYMNRKKRHGVRFRTDSELYADRKHYIDEFRLINKSQSENFPKLNWIQIENQLFHQRPLKAQKKGSCRFYPDQERAHKSLPSTHRFRILQELANLRIIGENGESVGLSREERDIVYRLLETQKTLSFSSLRKKLGTDYRFNLEDGKRDKLLGNEVSCLMRKTELFGDNWDTYDEEKQDEITFQIMEADDDEDIIDFLRSFNLTDEQKSRIVDITLPTGIARYSAVLHRECVHVMHKEFVGYSDALAILGFDHRLEDGKGDQPELPYYGKALPESCIVRNDPNQNADELSYGKIGNPTVHIALNQLRKVVTDPAIIFL